LLRSARFNGCRHVFLFFIAMARAHLASFEAHLFRAGPMLGERSPHLRKDVQIGKSTQDQLIDQRANTRLAAPLIAHLPLPVLRANIGYVLREC
jgi:hypothetical protein